MDLALAVSAKIVAKPYDLAKIFPSDIFSIKRKIARLKKIFCKRIWPK
jgi:hypothetical protein